MTNFVGYDELSVLERHVGDKVNKDGRPLKHLCTVHISIIIQKIMLKLLYYGTVSENFCIHISWNSRMSWNVIDLKNPVLPLFVYTIQDQSERQMCIINLAYFLVELLCLFLLTCQNPFSRCAYFNPLKTKRRPLYLKTQFVPRSKHFSSRL